MIESFGKTYDNDLRLEVTGTVEKDSARIMIDKLGLDVTPEEFGRRVHELQLEALPRAQVKPGIFL